MAADYESAERPQERSFPTNCWEQRDGTSESIHGPRSLLPVADASSEFPIFLSSFFSPCRCRRRARPPRQWIRHEESSESPILPAIDALFFYYPMLVYDACYVPAPDEACNGNTCNRCRAVQVTLERTVRSQKFNCVARNFCEVAKTRHTFQPREWVTVVAHVYRW